MTMFITKVWGFDNPCGPLVFGSSGWRSNAAKKLQQGDRVILVGTMGEETPAEDRNRVLGMMEPSTVNVSSSDFAMSYLTHPRLFTQNGSFRWPYGLLNYRAWEFQPGLLLATAAPRPGNPFGSAAASGIIELMPDEEARVLSHPYKEVPLLKSASADQKLYGVDASRRRGAPAPTEGVRRGIMHMRSAPADVYWFKLVSNGEIKGHKIGWAFDWRLRLRHFNSVALHSLGGLHYRSYRTQRLSTARQAFHVEQELLKMFDAQRHDSNREVLTARATADIEAAWNAQVTSVMLGVVVSRTRSS